MADNCTHDCASCGENCSSREMNFEDFRAEPHPRSNVKHVIAIASGKGGVGKSLVTSLLAVSLNRMGYKVAVLDADITGPSIPRAFGVKQKAFGVDDGIEPVASRTGVKLMSLNLLIENDTDPVVWRGPVIGGAVKQFWTDVAWGDIDYMFIDMPPGTGDVPLTVFQSLPVEGLIVVTSPQELVGMIVKKAVGMADMMNVPVWAIVENMAYFRCPDCGKEHAIFGESHINDIANEHGIAVTARLPIEKQLAEACDNGAIELFDGNWLEGVVKDILANTIK